MKCTQCNNILVGKQTKYCSPACIYKFRKPNLALYYLKNKSIILPKQIKYKIQRYKQDSKFRKLDNIRKIATHNISLKDKKCKKCKKNKDLQRHHPDYSKPKQVIILCRRCHNLLHEQEKSHAH